MVPGQVSILSNSNQVVLAINLVLGLTTDVNLLLTHGQMAHVLTHLWDLNHTWNPRKLTAQAQVTTNLQTLCKLNSEPLEVLKFQPGVLVVIKTTKWTETLQAISLNPVPPITITSTMTCANTRNLIRLKAIASQLLKEISIRWLIPVRTPLAQVAMSLNFPNQAQPSHSLEDLRRKQ